MPKFSDIFQEMQTPYRCMIQRIKHDVASKYGTQTVVTVNHGGSEFDWWLKPAQFDRLFTDEGEQKVFSADEVDIMKNPPAKAGQYEFYTLEKVSDGGGSSQPQPAKAHSEPSKSPSAPNVNAKAVEAQRLAQEEREMKDDLRDRRISIAGFTQALLTHGVPVDEAKVQGATLAVWCRNQAYAWYQQDNAKQIMSEDGPQQ